MNSNYLSFLLLKTVDFLFHRTMPSFSLSIEYSSSQVSMQLSNRRQIL